MLQDRKIVINVKLKLIEEFDDEIWEVIKIDDVPIGYAYCLTPEEIEAACEPI